MASAHIGEQLAYVQEAEKLGVHSVWTVEGWGYDAVTPLAFLAGQTNRIKLGTSIMQICARTPAKADILRALERGGHIYLRTSLMIIATKDALEVAKKETLRVTLFDVICMIV